MTWLYRDVPFDESMIGDNYGFIYQITNLLTNQKYVGRKYFYSKKTRPALKGTKRKRHEVNPSNWKDYYGSCKELLDDIERLGKENFKREILSLHPTKGSVNYHETKELFCRNVLHALLPNQLKEYYNNNIMNRYFANKIK